MLRRFLRRRCTVTSLAGLALVLIVYASLPSSKSPKREQQRRASRSHHGLEKVVEAVKSLKEKDNRYVIYNRVPKCGSMSLTVLSYKLGSDNEFEVTSPYEDREKPSKTELESSEFINYLYKQQPGFMYIRHQYFIDFTEFGHKQPLYINMIRDPVSRFQSFYYFSRFGNEKGGGGAKTRMKEERRQESIDECIQKRRQECVKPYWQVVPYFCGQEPGCMSRSQWALDRAKENIKKHYVFVGILEDFDSSLQILEILLPRYFKNARELYYENPENDRIKVETQTRDKREPSEAAKNFLKTETSLRLEYELYHFVKRHMMQLKRELL